jgi:transcriptional regulator with XRE-family HTH domain
MKMKYQAGPTGRNVKSDIGPPPMYRAELLRVARNRDLSRTSEFRNLAAKLNLSVNTIREALAGRASKIETLWILANHFEIPWLQLFDVKKQLEFENGRPRIPAKRSPKK